MQDRGRPTDPFAAPAAVGTVLEVEVEGVAAGGDGLARTSEGRVAFVAGALLGERVRAEVVESRKDFARLRVLPDGVLRASPHRVEPPCPQVARGCGGCDLLHASPEGQSEAKREVVRDALVRLGGVRRPPLVDGVRRVPETGYRTTVHAAVTPEGRPALRRRHSTDLVPLDLCLVAHPLVEQVLVEGRFPKAREVTVRASVASGEVLVVAAPRVGTASVPEHVRVVPAHALPAMSGAGRGASSRRRTEPSITEVAGGRPWRVSARSFFQSGPAAADLLVDAVDRAVGSALDHDVAGDHPLVVDAYAGIGLLGGSLAQRHPGLRLEAIESHPSAAADAERNLRGELGQGGRARVRHLDVGEWDPTYLGERADLVVADPARTGLGREAAARLAAAAAPVLVLVSCDPASLGRDTRLLLAQGLRLTSVEVLDLFPGTSHVEAVARFE